MQLRDLIANAENVHQEASRERNPYKKDMLLQIERLFRRLAEVERIKYRRSPNAHERVAAE